MQKRLSTIIVYVSEVKINMIKTHYTIYFKNGDVQEIWAFSLEEAKILAQAEEIKKGRDFTIATWFM